MATSLRRHSRAAQGSLRRGRAGSAIRSALGAGVALFLALGFHVGCGSETDPADGSSAGGGQDDPSGAKCTSEGTQLAPCEADSDCFSNNCQPGTNSKICYGGNGKGPSCSSDEDCLASAPSSAVVFASAKAGDYAVSCAGGGCVVDCKQ